MTIGSVMIISGAGVTIGSVMITSGAGVTIGSVMIINGAARTPEDITTIMIRGDEKTIGKNRKYS
jgi:F0F1-type ATP synthase membrane subunit c/vacuolar-type H+-ATPase subunit K